MKYPHRFFIAVFLLSSCANAFAARTVTLSSANPAVAAATIGPGAEVPIYSFTLNSTGTTTCDLTRVAFVTTGTYTAPADITTFKLWYSAGTSIAFATQLGVNLVATGAGTQTFAVFSALAMPQDKIYNFWITADVAAGATVGRTITVTPAITAANLTWASAPTMTVADFAGGTQTIGQTINTGTVSNPICKGASVNVSYSAYGTYTGGNVFTAQLSDAAGSFAAPTTIGTVTATVSGTIVATIPGGTANGTGYLIRVISSTPAVTGTSNSNGNITISTPMTYATSAVSQVTGNINSNCALINSILEIQVVVTGSCTPLSITQFNFNTTGSTNPPTDISKAKVYYTAQTQGFTTSQQFGTAVNYPSGAFTIDGIQP
ncbi:MAG: hypothetical protein HY840_03040, partial [Bacteroidetes bacterium]|nr:hypothetical protein [Bacteroidota bacterium]